MMAEADPDISETLFMLPADAKLVPLAELSPRIRAMLGNIDPSDGQVAVSRPGFRTTTRLITPWLADLLGEFREPSRLTDAVLRFGQAHARDPFDILDDSFEALSLFITSHVLVPSNSASAHAIVPTFGTGQAVADYEVERLVSSLEDTEVYLVRDAEQRPVALKIARSDVPEAVVQSLANEARILRHLSGGKSPALIEHAQHRGRSFIAMEWRKGTPITVPAQQARASLDRGAQHRLCRDLLSAYSWLHQRGVIHGDVHPGNIIVDDKGNIAILDFGRSRLAPEGGLNVDAPDLMETEPTRAGIPYFYEPEIARALLAGAFPPAETYRAEQYSLAALIYFLLTGSHYLDFAPEHESLLSQIVERSPLPFAARGLESWPKLEAVLATALAKDPAKRFESVAQFLDAFDRAGRSDRLASTMHRPQAGAKRLVGNSLRLARHGWVADGDHRATGASAIDLAYFSLRAALIRDDPLLLASADIWANRGGINDDADWCAKAVAAEVDLCRVDPVSAEHAIGLFLSACEEIGDRLDVLGGRSGALIAAARLLEIAATGEIDIQPLQLWARRSLEEMWQAIDRWPAVADCRQLPHLGAAHGWAGLLYATLRTCRAASLVRPKGLTERLAQLADLAQPSGRGVRWYGTMPHARIGAYTPSLAPGWCSGSAGYVELWALVYEETADPRYLSLAERAGYYAVDHPADNPDYCCGTTGRAFALLRLYQITGESIWLAHADRLANSAAARWNDQAHSTSLLKGSLGTALFLLERERPERAISPMFVNGNGRLRSAG